MRPKTRAGGRSGWYPVWILGVGAVGVGLASLSAAEQEPSVRRARQASGAESHSQGSGAEWLRIGKPHEGEVDEEHRYDRPGGGESPVRIDPTLKIIDFHTHLGSVFIYPGAVPNFRSLLAGMDAYHVETVVDFHAEMTLKHGIYGKRVTERLAVYPASFQDRVALFANVPMQDEAGGTFLHERMSNYPAWAVRSLNDSVARGARGLKVRIQVGGPVSGGASSYQYFLFDRNGVLVPHDSPVFDPLWSRLEALRLPVVAHLGTRKLSYQEVAPNDTTNKEFHWELLMLERERVLRKHPRLRYLAQHLASSDEDLSYLMQLLEQYPNLYTEGACCNPPEALATYLTAYQDQVLFGTDFMEDMSFQPPYEVEVSEFLGLLENIPLAQEVREKYLYRNAKQLLGEHEGNARPVAHPGFTATVAVGTPVTLDGSASYDFDGDPLSYTWGQVSGPPVFLPDPHSAQPLIRPRKPGTAVFELVVSDGQATSQARRVRVNAVPIAGAFVENDGVIVMEAEAFYKHIPRGRSAWQMSQELSGYSGTGYMVATPDQGETPEIGSLDQNAAELQYVVYVSNPGTWVVHARGHAPDLNGDSVHIGLDGEEVRLADRLGLFRVNNWSWVHTTRELNSLTGYLDTNLAVLNIVEPGYHLINVWMAEDGLRVDTLILARHMYAQKAFPLFDPEIGDPPNAASGP